MEKKTKFFFLAAALLLAGIGGAVIGFKVGGIGRSGSHPGSGLDHRKIEDLKRGLEEGSQRSVEGIEGAISGARGVEERIGRIGEDAEGVAGGLEDIGGIVEELQKRSKRKDH